MVSIGRNLETKGVIMALLILVLMNISCEDKIDNPAVNPSEGKTVEVSLHIGFADEADGYTVATKSGTSTGKGAFSYELQPNAMTKGDVSVKPDLLYNLEIQQYDQSGKRIGGMPSAVMQQATGSAITLSLVENPDCQLVIVAWGDGNTSPRLGTGNTLEAVQKLSIDASIINNIPADNMNKMPYILHLEHVKVSSSGKLQSVDGEDVRLLLKRLAARLTLNWTYSVSGEADSYELKQILLESIPTNYNVIPKPDKSDETYPSLLDQFTTIQVDPSGKSSYSCWIPANVRGTNPAATSQSYRIKSNAPTGSSYVSFIAVNGKESKKKLNYRVYLGGRTTFDFNLYNNTNYNYEVNFNHTGLPTNDRRVTIIDPIPASENNDNLVPTANCFMVTPGGAFCFNPYKFYQQGITVENSLLQGSNWCNVVDGTIGTPIKSVKVLWQTKENGDIGDPVLGVVNSSTDHTNIVDLTNGDDLKKARIYCRVAPNTTGGSGLIAAYDDENGTGNILWSWHIWVTDYRPDPKGNVTVVTPEYKRKQKYTYNSDQFPMMDRNLGAFAGYTDVPSNQLGMSKANGFHYQWGRKDPFPSSYSASIKSEVSGVSNLSPVPDMLNQYGPDGLSYIVKQGITQNVTLQEAYRHPTVFYYWGSTSAFTTANSWNDSYNHKTIHDPCPAGWRIASKNNYKALFQSGSFNVNTWVTGNAVSQSTSQIDGGYVLYYEAKGSGNTTYYRMAGYRVSTDIFRHIGEWGFIWTREEGGSNYQGSCFNVKSNIDSSWGVNMRNNMNKCDAHTIRCIQEQE